MVSNITCFSTQVEGEERIECFGSGPWIPCLYPWLHDARTAVVTDFIGAGLLAADFSPAGGGRVCFTGDAFAAGGGFVQLIHSDGRTQRISRLHFWGILQALVVNRMQHHTQGDGVGWHHLEALAAALTIRLREDATQGVVHVKSEQLPWSNVGVVQATIVSIQHAQGFLPEYPEERFWEELRGSATDLVQGRVHTAASTWARVETTRTNVVDYLTLAGVWGNDLTEDFLDSTSAIQHLATSYVLLRRYADHPLRGQLRPTVSPNLSLVPFGIDWFWHVTPKLPADRDVMHFTAACEAVWLQSSQDAPTSLPAMVMGSEVLLFVDWISVGQLGLVDVRLLSDLAEGPAAAPEND